MIDKDGQNKTSSSFVYELELFLVFGPRRLSLR